MAGAVADMSVTGLKEVRRAFAEIDRDLTKTVRKAILIAAVPVRLTAEQLALSEITNIGSRWYRMRVGATATLSEVYIVPASRRRRGSPRRNLGPLLIEKAMDPAAKQHELMIEETVTKAFDYLVRGAGFY